MRPVVEEIENPTYVSSEQELLTQKRIVLGQYLFFEIIIYFLMPCFYLIFIATYFFVYLNV